LTVTNPGGTDTKTTNNYITVSSNLTHSASISSPNTDICQGQTATFTLTSSNQGVSPVIEWMKNGSVITGTSGLTTVVLSGLANGDIITSRETSSLGCANPATIVSNALTMIVSPNLVHTASISSPKTQLCSGESAAFTLTNSNPGSSPVINWYRNGVLIPGTSGLLSITIPTPANGDMISAMETSSAKCASPVTITTNTLTLSVTAVPAKPVITQNAGNLISSAVSGNQWYLNSSVINGATNQVYRPLTNGIYQVQVTVNGCQGPISDPVTLTIEGVNILYPVPSTGQVTFDFYIPVGSAKYQATLFNSLGQLVYKEDGTGQPGMNRIMYNWDRLAAGVYTFQLQAGAIIYKKRLILQ